MGKRPEGADTAMKCLTNTQARYGWSRGIQGGAGCRTRSFSGEQSPQARETILNISVDDQVGTAVPGSFSQEL